jgi:hypothetical protein
MMKIEQRKEKSSNKVKPLRLDSGAIPDGVSHPCDWIPASMPE